jgi:hypothetical protein
MKFHSIPGLFLLAALPCVAQNVAKPHLSGYITRIASPQDFDVNGQHIQLSAATTISIQQPPSSPDAQKTYAPLPLSDLHPYFGEPAEIYGDEDTQQHSIHADRLLLGIRTPNHVSGSGIIDAVLSLSSTASSAADRLIRADGYLILISAATVSTFKKPLASASDIQLNRWVRFQGTQRVDGIVVADKAQFTQNVIQPADLRRQTDCDPPAAPDGKSQSSDAESDCDIRLPRILPSTDSAMQARISAIGARLIPRYQLALPATETTRINFRFRLIADNKDTAKWYGALALPDGIILIPHAVVDRLENDSQIAAVLADNIASTLEKQSIEVRTLTEKGRGRFTADAVAAGALSAAVGGVAGATLGDVFGDMEQNRLLHAAEDQSGRVSLWLLHDAGYDIDQVPVAWWLLSPKKPQPIADTPLPRRSASLYQFLGDSWPTDQALSAQTAPSPAAVTSAPAAQ